MYPSLFHNLRDLFKYNNAPLSSCDAWFFCRLPAGRGPWSRATSCWPSTTCGWTAAPGTRPSNSCSRAMNWSSSRSARTRTTQVLILSSSPPRLALGLLSAETTSHQRERETSRAAGGDSGRPAGQLTNRKRPGAQGAESSALIIQRWVMTFDLWSGRPRANWVRRHRCGSCVVAAGQ